MTEEKLSPAVARFDAAKAEFEAATQALVAEIEADEALRPQLIESIAKKRALIAAFELLRENGLLTLAP